MQHIFYFDGDSKKIAWSIESNKKTTEQSRIHADIYFDKVTNLQSKYISLHVGIFWCIGVFIIKNEDNISIKMDDQKMFEHLSRNEEPLDNFIKTRTDFIIKFINQRKLKVDFELIDKKNNLSSKLI